jgi:hypothetical protein
MEFELFLLLRNHESAFRENGIQKQLLEKADALLLSGRFCDSLPAHGSGAVLQNRRQLENHRFQHSAATSSLNTTRLWPTLTLPSNASASTTGKPWSGRSIAWSDARDAGERIT